MSINYVELKAGMSTAGFPVSAGAGWTAADAEQYRSYIYLTQNNVPPIIGFYGLAYEGLLPIGSPGTPTGPKVVTALVITGSLAKISGTSSQLVATVTYDDNTTAVVTNTATWVSATPSVATVSSTGLVAALNAGTSAITAQVGTFTSAPSSFVVTALALSSISLAAGATSIVHDTTTTITPTGHYNDGSTHDLTGSVTFTSSSLPTATIVSSTGVLTGVAAGTTNITAANGSITSPPLVITVT